MNLRRLIRSPLSATAAGVFVWVLAADASAAWGPCEVPLMTNATDAAVKLRNCVDAVNTPGWASPTEITFEGSQSYALDKPLVLERDVIIHGEGQTLIPDPTFVGNSLLIVGAPCGPSCGSPVSVLIEKLEFDGTGSLGVRGVDLLEGHELTLDDTYLHDLSTATSGGCIRAAYGSSLILDAGIVDVCTAVADGGGLFTEAGVTVINGTNFLGNEANQGGAVYFGGSGTSSRKLRIWDALFKSNVATDGGAIATDPGATNTRVSGSTFALNDADRDGGGFYGGGEILDCEFVGNTAGETGGGAMLQTDSYVYGSQFTGNAARNGGGVAVIAKPGFEIVIARSSVSNNRGNVAMAGNPGKGAGIYIGRAANLSGNVINVVRNSTISGNVMAEPMDGTVGGGLALDSVIGELEHVTLADNEAESGRAVYAAQNAASRISLQSSIMSNTPNPANPAPGPVCELGPLSITTTSLDTDGSCGVTHSATDPALGPLRPNGGPTPTHLPTAPAVLGTAECFSPYDQRGVIRPTSNCDIGSVQQ